MKNGICHKSLCLFTARQQHIIEKNKLFSWTSLPLDINNILYILCKSNIGVDDALSLTRQRNLIQLYSLFRIPWISYFKLKCWESIEVKFPSRWTQRGNYVISLPPTQRFSSTLHKEHYHPTLGGGGGGGGRGLQEMFR